MQQSHCFFYFLKILIVLTVSVVMIPARADEVGFDAKIKVSSSDISIKDSLQVQLFLTFPEGYKIDSEALRRNLLRSSNFYEHSFSIVDMQIEPPKDNSQQITWTLQPLRVGDLFLTFYTISFLSVSEKNSPHQIVSPLIPIHVSSIKENGNFQADLKPLLTFDKTIPLQLDTVNRRELAAVPALNEELMQRKRFPWIDLLGFCFAGFALWYFIRNPPIKPALTVEQMAIRARKSALLELERLRDQHLPEKGYFDEFYVHLTSPIRTYIEKRYNIAAPTSTTSEFLVEMRDNSQFSNEMRQQLGAFLIQADKVKFGRYRPSLEECEQAQQLAFQLISNDYIAKN